MKLIAIILLALGGILLLASIIIFFATDCFAVFKDLKTTRKVNMQMPSPSSRVNDIYYEKQAEQLIKKPKPAPPKFKRDEGFDAITDSAFHQVVKPDQNAKPASKITEPHPIPIKREETPPSREVVPNKTSPKPAQNANTEPLVQHVSHSIEKTNNRPNQTEPLNVTGAGKERNTEPLIHARGSKNTEPLIHARGSKNTEPLISNQKKENKITEPKRIQQQTEPLMKEIEQPPVNKNTQPLITAENKPSANTEPLIIKEIIKEST